MWGKFVSAAAAACVFACGTAGTAIAMNVTPIQVEMTSAGGASHNQVTVTNTTKSPMPVETFLEKLQLDENGKKKLSKAGEDFLVFPPQAIIPAGGTQVFRLQWVGEPMLAQSQSYIFSVAQVPVKYPKGQSKVQVVLGFGVVINVAATQVTPSLKVIGTAFTTDKQGKRRAVMTVENPTKTHALLPDGTINLSGNGWSKNILPAEIKEKVGIGLVQPGMRRRFVLPVDVPASVTSIQANLDYHPKR
jgi:fimbrial chaperone protein